MRSEFLRIPRPRPAAPARELDAVWMPSVPPDGNQYGFVVGSDVDRVAVIREGEDRHSKETLRPCGANEHRVSIPARAVAGRSQRGDGVAFRLEPSQSSNPPPS